MQPTYISVGHLFGAQTRHTVPLFQRPYVWNREEQWEPLWDDLLALIRRVLERADEANVAGHFLGTVVLEQAKNATGSLPRREVIDGQQRMTTLQILLKAAEHALSVAEKAAPLDSDKQALSIAGRQIAFLTENPAITLDEERYKIWPTNEDRAPFRGVMDSTAEKGVAGQATRMADAYRYFREVFLAFLAGPEIGHRAQAFSAALKDHVRLIVLDLDTTDEPQAIFETLNAHGTPLLPADLMKNWLLWEATRQKLPLGPLYEEHWSQFDRRHDYWRERVGVGHAARARVDTFLQNWLTRRVLEPVSAKHLYDRFLRYVGRLKQSTGSAIDIDYLMSGIKADADRYEKIDKPNGSGRFNLFLKRLKVLDIIVFHPLILALMARSGSDQDDLEQSAITLESYLVRRMICGQQTRGYGTLALALTKIVQEAPDDAGVAPLIAAHLRAASEADAWPNDDLFQTEWSRRKFYGGLRRDRVLMILQALEQAYQRKATKAEPILDFDYDKLQIEHILPQKWADHWPLDPASGTSADRDYALHGIGNLTLVSERLNPSLSNAPWTSAGGSKSAKRDELQKHSKLELTRRLLTTYPDWNEHRIRQRAQELFDEARAIWPV